MTRLFPIAVLVGVLFVSTAAVADDNAALVKRGEYLVNGPAACANCPHRAIAIAAAMPSRRNFI